MSGAGDFHRPDVLLPSEVESYVETLGISTFEELGSNRYRFHQAFMQMLHFLIDKPRDFLSYSLQVD